MKCELTKEEVLDYPKYYSTVGDLKKFLLFNNIPDDAPILVQRVEDSYYEDLGWKTYKKEAEASEALKRLNNLIDNNEVEWKGPKFTEEQIKNARTEYTPVWCPVFYKEDPEILFLDLHY